MKVGDTVSMTPMWKHDTAIGVITKTTKDGYVVVKWDNIPGEWYFTSEQSKSIEGLRS